MKVLHLNTSDIGGGATRAAYRLHKGLCNAGVDSQMYVKKKVSDDWTILASENKLSKITSLVKPYLDMLHLKRYPSRTGSLFSPASIKDNLASVIEKINPDIVHLHWVGPGFIKIETLGVIKKPIVWTMHDLWAFTGGCHYPENCKKYLDRCGACHVLGSSRENDLSRKIWQRKNKSWSNKEFTVVCPSNWLAKCAKNSSLFGGKSVCVIPNGINLQLFKPIDKTISRNILGLPDEKKLILFGAMNSTSDHRKGYHLLLESLKGLSKIENKENIELVVFGASEPKNIPDYGIKVRYVGKLHDEYTMSLLYSSVDVFVAPSLQDNLPNTVIEAMACGVPCVAFDIGGMPDMIEHKRTGYLARPYEVEDFKKGILWVVDNNERRRELSSACRHKVEACFSDISAAQRYSVLYDELTR